MIPLFIELIVWSFGIQDNDDVGDANDEKAESSKSKRDTGNSNQVSLALISHNLTV